jgi:hypothetical protein
MHGEYEDSIEPAKCEGIAHRLCGGEIVFGLEILGGALSLAGLSRRL